MVIMPGHRANQHVSAEVTITAHTNLEDSIDEGMEMSGSTALEATGEENEKLVETEYASLVEKKKSPVPSRLSGCGHQNWLMQCWSRNSWQA